MPHTSASLTSPPLLVVLALALALGSGCRSGEDEEFVLEDSREGTADSVAPDDSTAPLNSTEPDADPTTGADDSGDVGDTDSDVSDGDGDENGDGDGDADSDSDSEEPPLDLCMDVDCSGLADQCNDAACDPETGECIATPARDGEACDDGDLCTVSVCDDGLCRGPLVDCAAVEDECNGGACDPGTGECVAAPAREGLPCGAGEGCSITTCSDGVCEGPPVDCSALADACNDAACDPDLGSCVTTPVRDGEACDDGDLCTVSTCNTGECLGPQIDCSALEDQCNDAACDPGTGECATTPARNGVECDDGDLCSISVCDDGECLGPQIDCSGPEDQCNDAVCDPATGACTTTPARNGDACDDGDLCTEGECSAGECTVTFTETCPTMAASCSAGICDPALGCVFETLPDNASCVPDPNFCDGHPEAICLSGTCTPRQAPDCLDWQQAMTPVAPSEWSGETNPAGTPEERACPPSHLLTGARAYNAEQFGVRNQFVAFSFQCTRLIPTPEDGGWHLDPFSSFFLPPSGTGAPQQELLTSTCPPNHAVVGLEVVGEPGPPNGVRLHCAPLVFDATLRLDSGEDAVEAGMIGVDPLGDYPARTCGAGFWANGADVVAGQQLSALRLHCTDWRLLYTRTGQVRGPGSGVIRDADCPDDHVPVGVRATGSTAFWQGGLARLQVACAPATVDLTAQPPTFNVGATPQWLPSPGFGATSVGGVQTAQCPTGQMIGAFSSVTGAREDRISGVTLHCAEPQISGSPDEGYTLSLNPTAANPHIGTAGGGRLDCNEGLHFSNLWLRSGEIIDAVATRCRPSPLWRP